jgi:hypothetical protein
MSATPRAKRRLILSLDSRNGDCFIAVPSSPSRRACHYGHNSANRRWYSKGLRTAALSFRYGPRPRRETRVIRAFTAPLSRPAPHFNQSLNVDYHVRRSVTEHWH